MLDSLPHATLIPHGYCLSWQPGLIAVLVIGNLFIALAYFAIPLIILKFIQQRSDIDFRYLHWLFAAFIVTCGVTHLLHVVELWYPVYYLEAGMDLLTAVASVTAAFILWRLLPVLVSLPSANHLRAANDELKKVSAELQDREMQLRSLGDSLPDSFLYQYTLEGDRPKFIYLSSGVVRLNGVKAELAMQDAMLLLGQIEPKQREAYAAAQAASQRDLSDFSMDLHMLRAEGEWRWVQVRSRPRRVNDGQVIWDGIATDITDRHLLETEISRMAQAIEQNPIGILITDPQGTPEFMNEACTRISGYQFADAYSGSRTPRQIISSEMTEAEYAAVQTQLLSGKTWSGVLPNRHKNGKMYWEQLTVSPIYDSEGKVASYLHLRSDVTEQKNAEATRTQLAAIVESSNDAIIGKTPDGIITSWNKGAERIYGYSADEIIGQSITMLAPLSRHAEIHEFLEKVGMGGTVVNHESERARKDGALIQVALTVSPIRDASGNVTGISTIARDITERKRAEQQLSRRLRHRDVMERINQLSLNSASIEDLLGSVLDEILAVFNADRAFFLYPCDPDAPSWSVPMERTRPEWPGALARGMVIPTNPEVAEVFRELFASTEPLPYGPTAPRRSPASVDEQFSVQSQIQMALRPRVGSPWVMGLHHCAQARTYDEDELLIFKDIGQRVADALSSMIMLKNLRELNNDFVTLLENTGDFIYFKDQDSRIRFCSQTLANITGHPSWRDMIGKHDLEIFPKDTARIYYEEELPIFREGKTLLNKTDPYYDGQGRPGWVSTNKWPVFGDDKKTVVGIFGISRDITELKEAEDKINELNRDLERRVDERTEQLAAANKELEAFSYSVSHDLRSPLRAIDGFSHILLDDYADKLDEEGKRLLSVVRDNTTRMGQLIDDMLKFSRTGRVELTYAVIDMEKLAREVMEELQPSVVGAKLQLEIEPIHPAKGDSAMMRQVFVNLLSNAIKFSRSRETPRIKVGGSIEGNEAIYYVKDNGVGFDMQYADKLFGVFQRLHSVTEFEGTGIGLAIVKRVITRHGGRVWAEGKVGEGTTIYFALPTKEKEHG